MSLKSIGQALGFFNNFQITAYQDVDCMIPVFPTVKPMLAFDFSKLCYKFPFNPNSLSIVNTHEYNTKQPSGFSGINPKFKSIKPRNLSVQLIIDPGVEPNFMFSLATGMPIRESFLSLSDRVTIFDTIVGYNSSTHRPNYLLLEWGSNLNMKATLTNYTINYGRFNEKGDPTKANIDASFMEVVSTTKMLSAQDRQSPDVSHSVQIQPGDTLISLCEKIYGDPKFYIEIAKVNGLKSIRNIEPGETLYFPPLK